MAFAYHEPGTLAEALSILAEEGDDTAALAGGTDLLLRIRRGVRRYRSVVNIKFIPGLAGMAWDSDGGLEIGALTTFRAIELNAAARAAYPALCEAARVVAGVQLRNLATVGGNIGNASPSADSVPPLVALGATVEVASKTGTRFLPVEDALTGPGRTVLGAGEVFTSIKVPAPAPRNSNAFLRFGPRSAMDIGIASVATSLTIDADGRCTDSRIALGAVSPAPLRARASENALNGERLTPALTAHAAELAAADAQPISDIRASADYRRAIVRVLAERTIALAAARANGAAPS
jgi:aerobic carbon-monoxide dehydrogenase medium subunit